MENLPIKYRIKKRNSKGVVNEVEKIRKGLATNYVKQAQPPLLSEALEPNHHKFKEYLCIFCREPSGVVRNEVDEVARMAGPGVPPTVG